MSFKFPWGPQEPSPQRNEEVSLDDILPKSGTSRVDLILLIALCTDNMRDVLVASFEPPKEDAQPVQSSADLLLLDEDDEEATLSRQRNDARNRRRVALASSEMQGLKRAAVTFFNSWRTAVLRRMGESLNVRPDAVKQAKAKYISIQEAEARAKKDADFFAWAEGRDDDVSSLPSKDPIKHIEPPLRKVDGRVGLQIFKPIPTQLAKADDKRKALILNTCLFILLSLETYPAHSRVLIHYLCYCLKLPIDVLTSSESTLAITLLKSASSKDINTDDARKQKAAQDASSKKWKVGLATLGGAVLIGVTGGLAAPLLLGVAGSIMGGIGLGGLATLLGATIANPVTIAALFGTLGGRMSGKAMEEFAKEVKDFTLVPISKVGATPLTEPSPPSPAPEKQKLRLMIGISGWLLTDNDITQPWSVFSADSFEPFALRYEKDAMIKLGTTLDQVLRASAYTLAQAGAMQLALPAIAAAMLPVSLLKSGQFLDNPFSVAMERSDKAGKVLAAALISKAQGERPVNLVGFSLGARVIYSCLQELAVQKAFGLVESAVLVGSPVPSDEMAWRRMRSIVVGRLVNVYTTRDLLLGFLYRTRNAQLNIAGLQSIDGIEGVENKDVSTFVKGHNQYRLAMGKILKEINYDDLDMEAVESTEIELKTEDIKEQEIHDQAKREGKLRSQEDEGGQILMVDATKMDTTGLQPPDYQSDDSVDVESLPTSKLSRLNFDPRHEAPLFYSKTSSPTESHRAIEIKTHPQHRARTQEVDDESHDEQDDEEEDDEDNYASSIEESGGMTFVQPEPEPEDAADDDETSPSGRTR